MIACAPTGSGKTLSFLLPIVSLLGGHLKAGGFRALVIAPTRELVEQIHRDIMLVSSPQSEFKVCLLTSSMLNGFKANPPSSFGLLVDWLIFRYSPCYAAIAVSSTQRQMRRLGITKNYHS